MGKYFDKDIVNRKGKIPLSSRVKFPYLALSTFAKAFKDFIHFEVYNEFKGMIYASYNKGLQTVIQMQETSSEGDLIDYSLPIFNYDINLDEVMKEGNSYWRNSSLTVGAAKPIYEPFFKDDELELRIVYRRMKGSIPVNIYCSSQPEEIDIQMAFTDAFLGGNKYIVTPIRSYTVIPDSFVFDNVNGTKVIKDLTASNLKMNYIHAINKKAYYIMCNSSPLVRMNSLTVSNSLYGGKQLPEYTLTGAFDFEIEIPQYILAHSICYGKLQLDLNVDFEFERNNRTILNDIFGDIRYKESNGNKVVCENGTVIGQNAIVIENDNTTVINLNDIYPFPRVFLPTDSALKFYLDTPLGVLTRESGQFSIDKLESGEYQVTIKEGISFQKDDVIGLYVFKPLTEDDFS